MFRSVISRRGFFRKTAAVAAACAAPQFVPASALGRNGMAPPSERIAIGLIGCGNHGVGWNLRQIFRSTDAQVLAVCDVDSERLKTGQKAVDENYARSSAIITNRAQPMATSGNSSGAKTSTRWPTARRTIGT